MKNLFLLFFIILFLNNCTENSCNNTYTESAKSRIIIEQIIRDRKYANKLVYYQIQNTRERAYIDLTGFYDTVGKFNVGDTLVLIKK